MNTSEQHLAAQATAENNLRFCAVNTYEHAATLLMTVGVQISVQNGLYIPVQIGVCYSLAPALLSGVLPVSNATTARHDYKYN